MRFHVGQGVILIALFCNVVRAQQALDQFFIPSSPESYTATASNGSSGSTWCAQTFTVGLAGRLTQIDFNLFSNPNENPLVIRILPTSSGVPLDLSSALGSASYQPVGAALGLDSVTLPDIPALDVVPGEVLAISMSIDISNGINSDYTWVGNSTGFAPNGLYPGGHVFTADSTNPSWTENPFVSLGFR